MVLSVEWGVADISSRHQTILFVAFDTHGAPIRDQHYVQVYASFPDTENIGMMETFTCTALYERIADYSFNVFVQNYYGDLQFRVGYTGLYGRSALEINREDRVENGPWFADDAEQNVSYTSDYKNGDSTQKCSVARIIKETDETTGIEVDLGHRMDFKMGTEYQVQNGWKTWQSIDATEAD